MPQRKLLITVAVLFAPLFAPPVIAGNCLSSIMTVETLLVRMDDAYQPTGSQGSSDSPFRMTDVPSARRHLLQAKANLKEGLELNCQLEIGEALKRLGIRG
jgi:hypothetical protein